jgi:hypothetical protein
MTAEFRNCEAMLFAFRNFITDRTSQSAGTGIRTSIFNSCNAATARTQEVPLVHAPCYSIALSRMRSRLAQYKVCELWDEWENYFVDALRISCQLSPLNCVLHKSLLSIYVSFSLLSKRWINISLLQRIRNSRRIFGLVAFYKVRSVSKASLWVCFVKHSPAANEELIEVSSSMRSVSFGRKPGH